MKPPNPTGHAAGAGKKAAAVHKVERRRNLRCKIKQMIRVRPSSPQVDHFEEVRATTSVSRSGVYFSTTHPAYGLGMRLFVTIPYNKDPAGLLREYLAEVVRLDKLDEDHIGVGLKLLLDMGLTTGSSFS